MLFKFKSFLLVCTIYNIVTQIKACPLSGSALRQLVDSSREISSRFRAIKQITSKAARFEAILTRVFESRCLWACQGMTPILITRSVGGATSARDPSATPSLLSSCPFTFNLINRCRSQTNRSNKIYELLTTMRLATVNRFVVEIISLHCCDSNSVLNFFPTISRLVEKIHCCDHKWKLLTPCVILVRAYINV